MAAAASKHRASQPSGLRRQRGAVAITAAGAVLAGVVALALLVDLGTAYYAQRDLQRLANLAALDASRVASGCLGVVADPGQAAVDEAVESVLRNGGEAGWVTSNAVSILGDRVTSGGIRTFQQGSGSSDRAVEVTLSRTSPARIMPLFTGADAPTLVARSAAYNDPEATLFVGERGVDFDPADGTVLDGLFEDLFPGSNISASALTYEELLGYELPADDVFDELGLGTPDTPVDTPVSLPGLIQALIDAAGGNLSPAAELLAQQIYAAADASATVIPSEVLGVENPSSGALVQIGDVLTAAGSMALNGEPIEIPLPPPLGNGSTTLRIINPASPATFTPTGVAAGGGTLARSAAVVAAVNVPISIPAIGTSGALQVYVSAVNATGEVEAFNCKRRGQPEDTVDVVASTSVTEIGFGRFDDITADDPQPIAANVLELSGYNIGITLPIIGTLSIPVRITISATGSAEIGERTDEESLDGMRAEEQRTLGSPSTGSIAAGLVDLASDLDVNVTIESQYTGTLSLAAQTLLNTTINSLDSNLTTSVRNSILSALNNLDDSLQPQLTALGVSLSGADVKVISIVTEQPLLFTH